MEKTIPEKINDFIASDEPRDFTSLLWAIVGIMNIRQQYGLNPDIETVIADIQKAHKLKPVHISTLHE